MPENHNVILSTALFAPVQYYCKLTEYPKIWIEKHENYTKQSYRNRYKILSANGIMNLSVPVQKDFERKALIKDIKIDYTEDWQRLHLKSLESAYNTSPYYEFLIDEFLPVFDKQEKYLFDLNQIAQQIVFDILEISPDISFTEEYFPEMPGFDDFRESIHPKPRLQKEDLCFKPVPYWQVFADKFGFCKNLSILDLLFSEGQNALTIISLSGKIAAGIHDESKIG
jgi:hypothetical protein